MTRRDTEAALGRALDRMTTEDLVRAAIEQDRVGLEAVVAAAPALAALADRIAARVAEGGRWVSFGAGTSGRLAVLDAVELLPTFGIAETQVVARIAGGRDAVFVAREGAEDDEERARQEVTELGVGRGDVLLGVSASGRTPYTLAAIDAAAALGAETALLTCNPVSQEAAGQVVVLATGPELLAGSTRMKAGTATKCALHTISLAVATRLGHVYGDRMVDLRIGSSKLRRRALEMVADLADVQPEEAARCLDAAGGSVKCAVVMSRLGLGAADARAALDAAGGHLRDALGSW